MLIILKYHIQLIRQLFNSVIQLIFFLQNLLHINERELKFKYNLCIFLFYLTTLSLPLFKLLLQLCDHFQMVIFLFLPLFFLVWVLFDLLLHVLDCIKQSS